LVCRIAIKIWKGNWLWSWICIILNWYVNINIRSTICWCLMYYLLNWIRTYILRWMLLLIRLRIIFLFILRTYHCGILSTLWNLLRYQFFWYLLNCVYEIKLFLWSFITNHISIFKFPASRIWKNIETKFFTKNTKNSFCS
jgi:hypothetical protein